MPDAATPATATTAAGGGLSGRGLTRREGLLALGLLASVGLAAGCSGSGEPPPGSATATPLPEDLAAEVAAEESALIAAYDAALAAAPGLGDEATALLTLIRDQHAQHLEALGGAAEPPPPSGSPPVATGAAAIASLIAAERAAARSRIRACVAADDADLARLLTFIGASEASHVPALRDLVPAGA